MRRTINRPRIRRGGRRVNEGYFEDEYRTLDNYQPFTPEVDRDRILDDPDDVVYDDDMDRTNFHPVENFRRRSPRMARQRKLMERSARPTICSIKENRAECPTKMNKSRKLLEALNKIR